MGLHVDFLFVLVKFFFRKKIVLSNKNIISSNHSCFGLREESSASLRGKEQCQPPQRSGRVRKAGCPTILQAEPNFSGGSSENSGFDSALSAWSWCLGCCQAPSVCKPMVPCFLRPDKVRAHSKKGMETCNLFEKKNKILKEHFLGLPDQGSEATACTWAAAALDAGLEAIQQWAGGSGLSCCCVFQGQPSVKRKTEP